MSLFYSCRNKADGISTVGGRNRIVDQGFLGAQLTCITLYPAEVETLQSA